MSHKTKSLIMIGSSVLSGSLLFLLLQPLHESICGFSYYDSRDCFFPIQEILVSFFFASIPVFLSSILLYFSSQKAFRAWSRFALWAVPIMYVILLMTQLSPDSSGGFYPEPGDQDIANFLLLPTFFAISLFLIIKNWKDKPKEQKTQMNPKTKSLIIMGASLLGIILWFIAPFLLLIFVGLILLITIINHFS